MASNKDDANNSSNTQMNPKECNSDSQLSESGGIKTSSSRESFGYKYLTKNGWYEGDGLGKNKHAR